MCKKKIDENATSFTDEELDFNSFSEKEQAEMGDFLKEFFSDASNFEDLIDEDADDEEVPEE